MIISETCQQKKGPGAKCFKKSDDCKRNVSTKVGIGSDFKKSDVYKRDASTKVGIGSELFEEEG